MDTAENYYDFPASSLTPGVVYELRVGAIPAGGTEEDIVYSSVQFTLDVPEETEPPVSEISEPTIQAGNVSRTEEGIHFLSSSTTLSWSAEGEVQGYIVRLEDSVNGLINETTTANTSMNVDIASLSEGVVYTLYVGAIPVGGTEADVKVANFSFARDLPEVTEPPVTQPPVSEISAPSIQGSGQSYSEGDVLYFADAVRFSWSARATCRRMWFDWWTATAVNWCPSRPRTRLLGKRPPRI